MTPAVASSRFALADAACVEVWATSALEAMLGRVFAELEPPKPMSIIEWAETHRVLSREEANDYAGPYDLDNTPALRGILAECDPKRNRRVVVQKAAQQGYTAGVVCNVIGYHVHWEPCVQVVMFPREKSAKDFDAEKFSPMVRATPGIPSEYETEACINWLIDREVKKVQTERPQDRLARVQADKIEMENAEKRGLLIPADQLEPKLRAAMIAAREHWRNEPARLAREVPGKPIKEIEELLAASFDGFLMKLSRWPDAQVVETEEGEE